jgi:hypothetical protein
MRLGESLGYERPAPSGTSQYFWEKTVSKRNLDPFDWFEKLTFRRRWTIIVGSAVLWIVIEPFVLPSSNKSDPLALTQAERRSAEDQRRLRYERQRREEETTAIAVGLCQSQPWLDRCR